MIIQSWLESMLAVERARLKQIDNISVSFPDIDDDAIGQAKWAVMCTHTDFRQFNGLCATRHLSDLTDDQLWHSWLARNYSHCESHLGENVINAGAAGVFRSLGQLPVGSRNHDT